MSFEKLQSFSKLIANLPDAPNDTMTSTELKQYWDSSPEELRQAFNKLIDDLESQGGSSLGADVQGISGSTVTEVLEGFKEYVDEHKNNANNPHNVTAAQLNVYTKNELAPFLQGGETYIQYEVFTIVTTNNGNGTFTYKDENNVEYFGNVTEEGYQTFTLRKGDYVTNANRVEAFVNDVLHRSVASGGLAEIDPVTVALTSPEGVGSEITIKYFGRIGLSGEHNIMIGEDMPPISESPTLWMKVIG